MFESKDILMRNFKENFFLTYKSLGKDVNEYPAWVPPFDNYDGTEQVWCIFEKTRLAHSPEDLENKFGITPDSICRDQSVSSFYIWTMFLYYSL